MVATEPAQRSHAPAIDGGLESGVRSYSRTVDTVFRTARGSLLVDVDGREYIDFLAGAGALNYGHNDPDMAAALTGHIAEGGIAHSLDLFTEERQRFLEELASVVLRPRGLEHLVQFTGPTGTNAVEAALKLARKVTGRTNLVAFTNSFHGVTAGSLAVTASNHHRMQPLLPLAGVTRMPYDGYLGEDLDTADVLERMLEDPSSGVDPPAAVVVETVQGEGGLNVASPTWLRRVADITRRHGALLIADEIQTGCGRTGAFFGFEGTGVTPDLVALSKSLSGFGLPLSVLLVRPPHDSWLPGEHNGTFRGNNHAFLTARVAIEKYWRDDRLMGEVERRSRILSDRLTAMAEDIHGAVVKGRGMMAGLDVGSGELAGRVCRRAFELGVVVETSGPAGEVVKVLAPLTTPDDLLERGLDLLAQAMEESGREPW